MSQVVGIVDVTNPTGQDTVNINQGYVRFYNHSLYGLRVTLGNGDNFYLPPQARKNWAMNQAAGNFSWKRLITTVPVSGNLTPPTEIVIEAFDPTEPFIPDDLAQISAIQTVANTVSTLGSFSGYLDISTIGGKGDGVFDNTAAIAAGQATLAAQGGGMLFFPPGIWLGVINMVSKVSLMGAGPEATILKLPAGANTDLVSGDVGDIALGASFEGGSNGGVNFWGIYHLTLDGNGVNQSSGPSYVLRVYGYGWVLENVRMRNGFSGGMLTDWNGSAFPPDVNTANDVPCFVHHLEIHDCSGILLEMGGPRRGYLSHIALYHGSGEHLGGILGSQWLHMAPNAISMFCDSIHAYSQTPGTNQQVAFLLEAQNCLFRDCVAEDFPQVGVALLASGIQWRGGWINGKSASVTGVQIGQTTNLWNGQILTGVVAPIGYIIDTRISGCEGAGGSLQFLNDGGTAQIIAEVGNSSGPYLSGVRGVSTFILLNGGGLGVTGTLSTTPSLFLSNAGIRGGALQWARSANVQTLVNGATIATAGVGYARVTEAGAVTTIILAGGIGDGQTIWVLNEANFTITFDVAANSHVADGATAVIPGLTARLFIWDTGQQLWYRAI